MKPLLSILIFTIINITHAFAWTPPPNTPIALNVHPRIMFIDANYKETYPSALGLTVAEMRTRLNNVIAKDFQNFIDAVDADYNISVSSRSKLDITTDAINYAFLYLIDPSVMISFTFAHTQDEYGAKAIEYADYIATQASAVSTAETKRDWDDYKTFNYGGGDEAGDGHTNFSLAVVNDWCRAHPNFTLARQQAWLDAIINIHDIRFNDGEIGIWASGHHFGVAQNGAATLGFYGDSLDSSGSYYSDKMDVMMATFNNDWVESFQSLSSTLFGTGSEAPQGEDYNKVAVINMMPVIRMWMTAFNENIIQNVSSLNENLEFLLYRQKGAKIGGKQQILPTDDSGTANYTSMWWGKEEISMYTIASNIDPQRAGMYKWLINTYYNYETGTNYQLRAVPYYFFNHIESISPQSPESLGAPLSKGSGGCYYMRDGFGGIDDTLIVFFTPKFHTDYGGHGHRDFASFRIHKHGDLAITRQIAKSYTTNVMATQNSMFNNTMGVLKSGEVDTNGLNLMGYRSGYSTTARYSTDAAFQTNGSNHVGEVTADDLEGTHYDYIDYDYSNSWDDTKVDYAERELVYLRSDGGLNDEYVVVFDRINSVDAAYKKFYLLHASFEPTLLNNSNSTITMTAENYPNDPDGLGGRWVHTNANPTTDNIMRIDNTYDVGHARMYNKTLFPASFQINKVGGPNHYWEDGEGKAIETPSSMTDRSKWAYGSYTIQVQSTTNQEYDTFLNVMQIGDSNTLSSMTDIVAVSASTDNMIGAHIKDSTMNKVVLFSSAKNERVTGTSISYSVLTTSATKHLLFGLQPTTTYEINVNGASNNYTSNSSGVIFFYTGDVAVPSISTITIQ